MSFSTDIFEKKLNLLLDTQDSIVSISQWVLFHHRHSREIAELWSHYSLSLGEGYSLKKLSLLYLCNDVVQQARHKRKPDFIMEFSKVLPGALNKMYHTLEPHIKAKVDRLLKVWSERQVFSSTDIKEMVKAIDLSKYNRGLEEGKQTAVESATGPVAPELKILNDTFVHLNQLADTSQSNLNQVAMQSKLYLPSDPSSSENLPSPKIYISKLNVLEKLCLMSIKNVEDLKVDRQDIVKQLDSLRNLISEGLEKEESKIAVINKKLGQLANTREELKGMIEQETSPPEAASEMTDQPPPPSQEDLQDENEELLPTYENDSDSDGEPSTKKQKLSPVHSNDSNSSSGSKKSVAFSDDVTIKEYNRDEETDNITVIKGNGYNDYDDEKELKEEESIPISDEYERHHKDDLELKYESEHKGADETPSSEAVRSDGNESSVNNHVLNILAKLA